jgi:hypothetical protein
MAGFICSGIFISGSTVTSHCAVKPPSSVVTVIVAVPSLRAVTVPSGETLATSSSLDAHIIFLFVAFSGGPSQ